MRKLYLTAIIIVIILSLVAVMAFYYLSMPTTTPNNTNEPQNQGNESQGSVTNPSRIPYNNQTNGESNESGGGATGGAGAGGGSGSGSSNGKIPTMKYNLSVVSDFSDLNFFVGYYYEGDSQNMTSGPPFSLSIDANTTVCIALNSGYQETYWTVDGSTYSMTPCYGYNNSCTILMDDSHEVRLKQYS